MSKITAYAETEAVLKEEFNCSVVMNIGINYLISHGKGECEYVWARIAPFNDEEDLLVVSRSSTRNPVRPRISTGDDNIQTFRKQTSKSKSISELTVVFYNDATRVAISSNKEAHLRVMSGGLDSEVLKFIPMAERLVRTIITESPFFSKERFSIGEHDKANDPYLYI